MKKLFFTIAIALVSLTSHSQIGGLLNTGKWDTSNCEKCSENLMVLDQTTIKYFKGQSGYFLYCKVIKNMDDDTENIEDSNFKNFPLTDRFILIGNSKNPNKTLLQNLRTKLYVVLPTKNFEERLRPNNSGLFKVIPTGLSAEEEFWFTSNWDVTNREESKDKPFVFDKLTISALEKYAKFSDDYNVDTPDKKKYAVRAYLKVNASDTIYKGYINLSEIPPTEKFILIGDNETNKEILIQNLKTKEFYIIQTFSFNYMDYSRHGADGNGYAQMIKIIPKAPSTEEAELLSRYKALIKSANINCVALQTIQRKYLTKGYFDANRVKGIDKQNFNKNLASLKVKADKLAEINRYEDKDDKAQDKLTLSELGLLTSINDWNINFNPLN